LPVANIGVFAFKPNHPQKMKENSKESFDLKSFCKDLVTIYLHTIHFYDKNLSSQSKYF